MNEQIEIPQQWKKVLEDNKKLPEGNICALEDIELVIDTGTVKPIWVCQYPIPQALHEKVSKRINEMVGSQKRHTIASGTL